MGKRSIKKKAINRWKLYKIKPFEDFADTMLFEEYQEHYLKPRKAFINFRKWKEYERAKCRNQYERNKKVKLDVRKELKKNKEFFDELKGAVKNQIDADKNDDFYVVGKNFDEREYSFFERFFDLEVEYKYLDIFYKIGEYGEIRKSGNFFVCNNKKFYVTDFKEISEDEWEIEIERKNPNIYLAIGKIKWCKIVVANLYNKSIFKEEDFKSIREVFG